MVSNKNIYIGDISSWNNWLKLKEQGYTGVSGDFNCWRGEKLKSLKDAPNYVGGDFNISGHKVTSLKYCPEYVDGDFYATGNRLTSLKFSPLFVGGNFRCDENRLTSLKYCTKDVGEGFDCSSNELTSLEHCPSKADGYFDCDNNKLTSLEFCPKNIDGFFSFSNNLIKDISLSNFPNLTNSVVYSKDNDPKLNCYHEKSGDLVISMLKDKLENETLLELLRKVDDRDTKKHCSIIL